MGCVPLIETTTLRRTPADRVNIATNPANGFGRVRLSSIEDDRQRGQASPERHRHHLQFTGFHGQLEPRKLGDQVGDRHAGFHPGQVGAQAEVGTLAKRYVVVRISTDIEYIGVVEGFGVAIG